MNCKTAKSIDILAFMQKNGLTGIKKGMFFWYCSPFRDEKTESFSVDTQRNRWIDFGTGEKGDLLDLVKLMNNTDTPGALKILSTFDEKEYFSFFKAKKIKNPVQEPRILVVNFRTLIDPALLQYLKERKITSYIAREYTESVYYELNEKRYFAISFKNDKGGYEFRNKYYKNCLSPKYYTTINIPESRQLTIFEGFFDFLSALTYYDRPTPKQNTIILNSLSFLPLVIPLLSNYEKINLFLDNDESGKAAARKISENHPSVINYSEMVFPLHKDFNDFLINRNIEI